MGGKRRGRWPSELGVSVGQARAYELRAISGAEPSLTRVVHGTWALVPTDVADETEECDLRQPLEMPERVPPVSAEVGEERGAVNGLQGPWTARFQIGSDGTSG